MNRMNRNVLMEPIYTSRQIEIAKNTNTCFILVLKITIYRLLSIIIPRVLSIIKFTSLSVSETHENARLSSVQTTFC